MAVKDVKEYYFKLIAQKAELEADLADFEEALKNGFYYRRTNASS